MHMPVTYAWRTICISYAYHMHIICQVRVMEVSALKRGDGSVADLTTSSHSHLDGTAGKRGGDGDGGGDGSGMLRRRRQRPVWRVQGTGYRVRCRCGGYRVQGTASGEERR